MKIRILLIIILICLVSIPVIVKFTIKTEGETPQEKLIFDISDLQIEKVEDYDVVSIENCHYTNETGKPQIPYLIYKQNYTKNYKIQTVSMINRTNLQTLTNLNIPDYYSVSPDEELPPEPPYEDIGLYPKLDYDWSISENTDGSTDLLLYIFPLFYNRETKEAKFYKKFEFHVDYIFTPVKINYLYLDKNVFTIDEEINLETEIENTDKEGKDLLITSCIKRDDGEILDSIDIKEIKDLRGKGKINLIWKNQNKITGQMFFEVSIKDLEGTEYDSTSLEFSIGLPLIEITKFTVDKVNFTPKDKLNLTLEFVNKGAQKTDGNVVIKILDKEGTIEEINKEFLNLEKDKIFVFQTIWDTSDTKRGENYNINAIVYYYGTTSQKMIVVSTNKPPNADFSYTPLKIYIGEEVKFDASSSFDSDENIITYEWKFGDGWESTKSKIVTHKYEKSGLYNVSLVVKDSADKESKITKEINVLPKEIVIETIIIKFYIGKTTYYVNDELMTMDVAPIILEGRTLLPIRYVAETLGATVEWEQKEQKVTIRFKETIIELWIGNTTARVNGEYKFIDSANINVKPITIPPGRTMLPIRFIAENLGCKVDWNPELKEVKVTYQGE